ncbi:MAG: hypothetical protein ACRDGM_17810 [bacterium]
MFVAAYHILRDGVPYRDLGPDHFDRLATQQLGHRVTFEPAA